MKAIWKPILCIICLIFLTSCEKQSAFEEQKQWKSVNLAAETSSWIRAGATDADLAKLQFTNKYASRFICHTNIIVNGTSYQTVLRFEDADFQGKGYLVATSNGVVIWVGHDGKCEISAVP